MDASVDHPRIKCDFHIHFLFIYRFGVSLLLFFFFVFLCNAVFINAIHVVGIKEQVSKL